MDLAELTSGHYDKPLKKKNQCRWGESFGGQHTLDIFLSHTFPQALLSAILLQHLVAGQHHRVTILLSCLLSIRKVVKAGYNHSSVRELGCEFICRSQNSAQRGDFLCMGSRFSGRKEVSDSKVERSRERTRGATASSFGHESAPSHLLNLSRGWGITPNSGGISDWNSGLNSQWGTRSEHFFWNSLHIVSGYLGCWEQERCEGLHILSGGLVPTGELFTLCW